MKKSVIQSSMQRTNDSWAQAIHSKIAQVLDADNDNLLPPPLADLSSPDDSRFPNSIDHTLLTPDATSAQIDRLCEEAIRFKFKVFFPFIIFILLSSHHLLYRLVASMVQTSDKFLIVWLKATRTASFVA